MWRSKFYSFALCTSSPICQEIVGSAVFKELIKATLDFLSMNLSEVPLIFHLSGKLCGAGIGSIVTGTSEASLENPRLSSLPSGCPGRNSNHWILPVFSLFLRLRIIRIVYTQIFNKDRIIEYIRVSPYIRISA